METFQDELQDSGIALEELDQNPELAANILKFQMNEHVHDRMERLIEKQQEREIRAQALTDLKENIAEYDFFFIDIHSSLVLIY